MVEARALPSVRRVVRAERRRVKWPKIAPYFFALPFLLAFFAFVVAPLCYAAYLSVFKTTMVGGERFVGLANYQRAFLDPSFWRGLLNTFHFGVYMTPAMLALALLTALILDSRILRTATLFRVGIFVPYAIPGVIATLLWGYIYGPHYGLVAQALKSVSVEPPDLLGGDWIMVSLANISVWQYLGYNFIILYAALKAVPDELSEAAVVDGAKAIQIALHIKIPLIRSAIVIVLLFAIIGTIQLFNEPFLLMPMASYVISSDFTPNIYTYSLAFRALQYNYAGAISFVMGLITAIIAFAFLTFTNRRR